MRFLFRSKVEPKEEEVEPKAKKVRPPIYRPIQWTSLPQKDRDNATVILFTRDELNAIFSMPQFKEEFARIQRDKEQTDHGGWEDH